MFEKVEVSLGRCRIQKEPVDPFKRNLICAKIAGI
jgi:hypothetical protein